MTGGRARAAVLGVVVLTLPLVACGPQPSGRYEEYAALGDSYTAAPWVPVTEAASGCLRSSGGYPVQLAARLHVGVLRNVACAGARTANGTTPQGHNEPQLDAVSRSTDLVTVSLGANDERVFGRLSATCAQAAADRSGPDCRQRLSPGGVDQIRRATERTRGRLAGLLRQVRARAPHARVVAVGYPALVRPGDHCPDRLPWRPEDYAYVASSIGALNAAVRGAAADAGVAYLDVAAASAGHGICDAQPWVNGVHGDRAAAAPLHPFGREQTAIADLLVRMLT
ncbi:SGNH/GDSL hydrolase family protein [Luteipulveratus flavus]|uniref:SGNH/GDSL hydrolase family protein n=1 Tax=Luteipulveratus flavus TaxID=3031728 RepID=A0ABT6C3A3_9MICO|nr:SGNH/GDSL hydrolase family protein [Luteipulveratus sp. YIM 133296]MDF8262772.1 SGNH/GDSL hydrolase family protein [Luteipulveratus sp. YIM 133296]